MKKHSTAKIFAVKDSESESRFIFNDNQLVEVSVLDPADDFVPEWELGEVEIDPELPDLDIGDITTIVKAQDNPLLRGLELTEGTELELVLVISTF